MDVYWWSIEVRDGGMPASMWQIAYMEALTEAAITHGAREWHWVEAPFGVVLELGFAAAEDWYRFRALPAVTAALDAVPDAVHGLYVYPGRGGGSGASLPRNRPRPAGAGAAPLPETPEPVVVARPGSAGAAHLGTGLFA